jgi:hypothetical protein
MSKTRKAAGAISLAVIGGASLSACASSSTASPSAQHLAQVPLTTRGATASSASKSFSYGASTTINGSSDVSLSNSVGEDVTAPQPLIVRTGSVTLGVNKDNVVNVFDKVSVDAAKLGGYVESSSSSSANDAGGANLVVRVPGGQFNTLVAELDPLGRVEAQSENGNDVTGESIDLQAQLENLKSEESALRALVAKATSVSSILEVQNQLFGVEGDIQQLTAQENSLLDQATYSTMTVSLTPLAGQTVAKSGPNAFTKATKTAAHNSSLAVKGIVYGIGWAFPGIVLAAIVGLLGRWVWRRRQTAGPVVEALEGAA